MGMSQSESTLQLRKVSHLLKHHKAERPESVHLLDGQSCNLFVLQELMDLEMDTYRNNMIKVRTSLAFTHSLGLNSHA